jgi:hypothetical protein
LNPTVFETSADKKRSFESGGVSMNKTKILAGLALAVVVTSVGFNNCGKVSFTKAPAVVAKLGAIEEPSEDGDGIVLNDVEIQEVITQIPPEQLDVIHPVSDLETDPGLYDVYKCGDTSVVICHFPNNVEDSHSTCVGRNAVSTHYDHIRSYVRTGVTKTIGDYLGPCRVAL